MLERKDYQQHDKNEKTNYEVNPIDREGNQNKFENIEEEGSYWKSLWKSEGTGNTEANWLEMVRAAYINDCVQPPFQEDYEPDTNQV